MPGTISYGKAVAEIAKYSVKGADYLVMWQDRAGFLKKTGIKLQSVQQCKDLTDEVVGVLDKTLHRRRLVAFGGELKRVHKLLNLDDPVDGDLVVTDNEEINKELAAIIEKYYWNAGVGNYVLAKARKA
jgi:plasmid rolling circle replication initiator protein Rep